MPARPARTRRAVPMPDPPAADAPPGREAYRLAAARAAARGDTQEVLALTRAYAWATLGRDVGRLGRAALRRLPGAAPWLLLALLRAILSVGPGRGEQRRAAGRLAGRDAALRRVARGHGRTARQR